MTQETIDIIQCVAISLNGVAILIHLFRAHSR